MILNDRELRALLKDGEFVLQPFADDLIQPSSIDLRLDRFVRRVAADDAVFDLAQDVVESELYSDDEIGDQGIVVNPGDTILGQTAETMKIPATCQGMIAQRSSIVRLGIHVSSSLVNPGYEGNLPLMITNRAPRPFCLRAGVPICQLVLLRLTGRPDVIYSDKPDAKYHGERKFLPSRVADDVRRWGRSAGLELADPAQAERFRKEVSFEDDDDEVV